MNKKIVGRCLLLELLRKSHMTQSDIAYKTGISRSQINEYIKNMRIMSLPNAKLIANALKCRMDDLYEWNLKE